MAELTRTGTPSLATAHPPANTRITGLLAGEDLAAGDACYVKTSDGKVYKSTGAAVAAAAKVRGFASQDTKLGEAVTLMHGVVFGWGTTVLSPGADYFLSGTTAGGLADAASTGGTSPVAWALDASRMFVRQSGY